MSVKDYLWGKPGYDIKAHVERVKALYAAYPYTTEQQQVPHLQTFINFIFKNGVTDLIDPVTECFVDLMFENEIYRKGLKIIEDRDYLQREERKLNPERVKVAGPALAGYFHYLVGILPQPAQSELTVPLHTLIPNLKGLVTNTIHVLAEQHDGQFVFDTTSAEIGGNILRCSGIEGKSNKPRVLPVDYDGDPLDYLQGTPLYAFFHTPVPLVIPEETRYSHTWIMGGTGAGKTQALQNLILQDLKDPKRPSLVVVDSQRVMIPLISRMKCFAPGGEFADRLYYLDPRENITLNIFDMNQERLAAYDDSQREEVFNQVMRVFTYIFDALLGSELSTKQSALFRYVVTLLLELPKTHGRAATLQDFLFLMEDSTPYQKTIDLLPELARNFFRKDFAGKDFNQTKTQIRYRIHAVLSNASLARYFLAPKNAFDWYSALNKGSVILVDTDKNFLAEENSSLFGRFAITVVLQAILERAANNVKYPTFLYIDEAGEYFDKSIDSFLNETRKRQCGIVVAHQKLEQLTESVKASVQSNTAIKLAGGTSANDAEKIYKDMRTTSEFILAQPSLSFATYIKGTTPNAVSLRFKYGRMESEPMMTAAEYKAMRERNRARVTVRAVVESNHSKPVLETGPRPADGASETSVAPQTTKPPESGPVPTKAPPRPTAPQKAQSRQQSPPTDDPAIETEKKWHDD